MRWVVWTALGLIGCGEVTPGPLEERVPVVLIGAMGQGELELSVRAVSDERGLERGLSAAPPSAPDEGLLLVFPIETEACINNLGVNFAIEALFVSADRQVIAQEHLDAGAVDPVCHRGTSMVLEIPRGTLGGLQPESIRFL